MESPPTGGQARPPQPFGRTNGAGGSLVFIARPSGGLVLEYDCTVPAQTPSLMGLTTCVGPMALPVVARPGVIAAARLTGEWPALSRLVSQPVIQRSRVSLTVQEKRISSSLNREQGSFIAMKSRSRKRTPNIVNLTVKRRYLTEREIERLMDRARKHGRYGHRDATMILVAYRHGLRASEPIR